MMNASYHSRLPEKLAAAEAREADERGAKGTNYQCLGMFLITPSSLKSVGRRQTALRYSFYMCIKKDRMFLFKRLGHIMKPKRRSLLPRPVTTLDT